MLIVPYRSSNASLHTKGLNFYGVLFCESLFLRELIFADRGQSAKPAKIKTPKKFHATW